MRRGTIMAVLVTVLMGGLVFTNVVYAADTGQADAARQKLQGKVGLEEKLELVAQAIGPSVVSIKTNWIDKPRRMGPRPSFPERDFPFPQQPSPQGRTRQAIGSGVIVDAEKGYILTNNHVVAKADKLEVTLSDERTFPAEVVGTDPMTDIAVIRIKADGLYPAKLGDSESLRLGQWVMAIGSPFGLEQSVTLGIVSAKGRSKQRIVPYENFIQTDAAINPGNSGGPLVDLKGEVVGINTAIFSLSGGHQGIGFAIPTKMARGIMETLIDKGEVVRGFLGVLPEDLTADLAATFGLETGDGVLLQNVEPNTPAAKAGLQPGDIVTQMSGEPVRDANTFRYAIARIKPGSDVVLDVWRDGKTRKIKVTIGLRTEDGRERGTPREDSNIGKLGLELTDPNPQILSRLRLPGDTKGAIVVQVAPGSPAEEAQLRPGHVIISVQGKAVANATEAWAELGRYDFKKAVRIRVNLEPRLPNAKRYTLLKISE